MKNEKIYSKLEIELINYFNKFLQSENFNGKLSDNLFGSFSKYFSFRQRLKFVNCKWKVVESSKISCPNSLKLGYEGLKKSLITGHNISAFLSKGVFKGDQDPMFNHWNIIHFHLGEKLERNGIFIERTNELAFVRFHKNSAYIVYIGNHTDWAKQDIVKILGEEFPQTLEKPLFEDYSDSLESFTDDEIKLLRKKNINVPMDLPNNQICMLSAGVTLSGQPTIEFLSYQILLNYLETITLYIFENSDIEIEKVLFHDILLIETDIGLKLNGLAFKNLSNEMFLYCVGNQIKYETELK